MHIYRRRDSVFSTRKANPLRCEQEIQQQRTPFHTIRFDIYIYIYIPYHPVRSCYLSVCCVFRKTVENRPCKSEMPVKHVLWQKVRHDDRIKRNTAKLSAPIQCKEPHTKWRHLAAWEPKAHRGPSRAMPYHSTMVIVVGISKR